MTNWIFLLLAGMLEMTWPAGLKLTEQPGRLPAGVLIIVVGMSASLFFLWLAQRTIPIGTAYAVWTGIGTAGTFILGIAFFGDEVTLPRITGVALIGAGVCLLKWSHAN